MNKLFNDSDVINTPVNQLLQLPTPSSSIVVEPTDTPSADETDSLASHTVTLIVVFVFLSAVVIIILVIVGILFFKKRR